MDQREQRLDNEELLVRALKGDVKAFSRLWKRYAPRLELHLRNLVGVSSLADEDLDDILQSVWLKALLNLKQLRDRTKVGAWLRRIAENEAFTLLNRQTRYAPLTEQAETVRSPALDVELWIQQHLERLSPDHREALILY